MSPDGVNRRDHLVADDHQRDGGVRYDIAWHTAGVPWLVSEERVLASAEIARQRRERRRGLLGRDHFEGALILQPCRWVHTLGMRFSLDVAYLDDEGQVVKTVQMQRNRVGIPAWQASTVLEAEAGAFARWGLRVGDVIEIRTDDVDTADLDAGATNDDDSSDGDQHPDTTRR